MLPLQAVVPWAWTLVGLEFCTKACRRCLPFEIWTLVVGKRSGEREVVLLRKVVVLIRSERTAELLKRPEIGLRQ